MRRTRSKFELVDPIVHVIVVIEGVLKVIVVVVANVVVVVVQSTLTHLLILI